MAVSGWAHHKPPPAFPESPIKPIASARSASGRHFVNGCTLTHLHCSIGMGLKAPEGKPSAAPSALRLLQNPVPGPGSPGCNLETLSGPYRRQLLSLDAPTAKHAASC